MNFPKISDLATTSVSCISVDASASEAVESIFKSKHRSAIVCDHSVYYLFTYAH